MIKPFHSMSLQLAGPGVIIYSPSMALNIKEEEDYFSIHYESDRDVQRHIQDGSIVGFGTGSPGDFHFDMFYGYPEDELLKRSEFKLRLGIRNIDGRIIFRDIYDLLNWHTWVPEQQIAAIPMGIYHITMCSNMPPTGVLGDHQHVSIYFNLLNEYPKLAVEGIPHLCT